LQVDWKIRMHTKPVVYLDLLVLFQHKYDQYIDIIDIHFEDHKTNNLRNISAHFVIFE
jgi:hypothetical protein